MAVKKFFFYVFLCCTIFFLLLSGSTACDTASGSDYQSMLVSSIPRITEQAQNFAKSRVPIDYKVEKLTDRGMFFRFFNDHEDRGCIFLLNGFEEERILELLDFLISNAMLSDSRYPSILESELEELHIEIGICGPFIPVSDNLDFSVGRDSLLIQAEGRRAVMQASLPIQYMWTKETYLSKLCKKAGLAPDYWKMNPVTLKKAETEWIYFILKNGRIYSNSDGR